MELQEVLKPIRNFGAIFGMFPMKVATIKTKTATITRFQSKKRWFDYLVITAIVSVITACTVYRQVVKSIYDTRGIIVASVEFLQYNCRIPTTIFCLVMSYRNCGYIINFLNAMAEMDQKFEKFGQKICYVNTKKLARLLVGLTVVKIATQHLPFFTQGVDWEVADVLDYVIFNVPLVLIHVVLLEWIILLNILRIHYTSLNALIKSLKYRKCWMVADYSKANKRQVCDNDEEFLKTAGIIYNDLFEQVFRVNKAFSPQILVVIPALFILIISSSFHVCQMIKNKIDFEAKTLVFNLLYFVSFVELVVASIFVKEEAGKFVDILHRIDSNCENFETDAALNSLILQSYHQKVEFSAYEIFPLDGTLMYSIFGALTTYLVILLQFDL